MEGPPIDDGDGRLRALRSLRADVRALLIEEQWALNDYVRSIDARYIIARNANEPASPSDPDDATNHFTCSAFVVSALDGDIPTDPDVNQADMLPERELVLKTVISDFVSAYRNPTPADEQKDAAGLPNAYSTPIQLSGLAEAVRNIGDDERGEALHLGRGLASSISEWLSQGEGLISGMDPSPPDRPLNYENAPYLTYLTSRALATWTTLDAGAEDREEWCLALERALRANVDYLSRALATSHAGAPSAFDAVDLICSVASVGTVARALDYRDEVIDFVVPHAVDIIESGFTLSDGSFAPKSAVLTTKLGYSLVLSTAELACILVAGAREWISAEQALRLEHVYKHVARGAAGPQGWGKRAGTARRPAFVAAAALSFCAQLNLLLDHQVSEMCATELGVAPVARTSRLEKFQLPNAVRSTIETRVLMPIRDLRRRDIAAMGLILGGPPGTAKTTIAKKVALELGWPLLELDQGAFLHKGTALLESEAERVFDRLSDLRDTVVLFDEIEEMVEDRGHGEKAGRFLTSSMLPRIHHLRDLGRVVFLIATNHLDRIDPAAIRPGRIDEVLDVPTPQEPERKSMLSSICEQLQASERLQELLRDTAIVTRTEGFTYGYLEALVKQLVAAEVSGRTLDNKAVMDALALMQARVKENGGSSS